MANLPAVDDITFDTDVLGADGKVVVDFWAPWCGPCKVVSPEVERLSQKYDAITFVKVNVDDAPNTAARYGIMGIPTIGLFEGGELVASSVGAKRAEQLERELGIG